MSNARLVSLGILLAARLATAGSDLRSPYALESTQVLPAGVKNPRFLSLMLSADTRFDDAGGQHPLAFRLNRAVTWNDVLARQTDDVDKQLIQSTLDDLGQPTTASPGDATGKVNAFIDVKAPIFAMGITENFTAALVVPIVRADVKVDTGFVKSTNGQAFIDSLCTTSPERCNDAAQKLNNATREKLASLGYQPVASKIVSGIGDIQLVGKYRLMNTATHALALKFSTSYPTGTAAAANDVLDITTGDLRFKAGVMAIYDRFLHRRSRWTAYGGGTILLPNEMRRRLPTSNSDPLSADEVNLTRQTSALVSLGTTVDYRIDEIGLTVTAGYSFQHQGPVRYRTADSAVSTERIGWLENLDPAQSLHAVTVAAGFSTVEWYQRKEFVLPFQLSAVYSRPFAGRNAPTAGIFSAELIGFF